MSGENSANEEKANWIFEQVFSELGCKWDGPKFDFDHDSYKARINDGPLRGKLVYLSIETLEDRERSVSALSTKLELVEELKKLQS